MLNWNDLLNQVDLVLLSKAVIDIYGPMIYEGGKVLLDKAKDKAAEAAVVQLGETAKKAWNLVKGKFADPVASRKLVEYELNPAEAKAAWLAETLEDLLKHDDEFAGELKKICREIKSDYDQLPPEMRCVITTQRTGDVTNGSTVVQATGGSTVHIVR